MRRSLTAPLLGPKILLRRPLTAGAARLLVRSLLRAWRLIGRSRTAAALFGTEVLLRRSLTSGAGRLLALPLLRAWWLIGRARTAAALFGAEILLRRPLARGAGRCLVRRSRTLAALVGAEVGRGRRLTGGAGRRLARLLRWARVLGRPRRARQALLTLTGGRSRLRRRRTGGASTVGRRARRIVAETAVLIARQRLRRRHIARRLHNVRGLLDRDGLTHYRVAPLTEFVGAHQGRTRNIRRACEHDRTHLVGRNRTAYRGRDDSRCDTRVHREIALANDDRAVLDHRLLDQYLGFRRRHHDGGDLGRREVSDAHQDPVIGLLDYFDDDLFGRHRCPADMLAAAAPIDEGRTPFLAGNPDPADLALQYPAPIVEGDPAPFRFRLVGHPIPPVVIGIDPMTHGIGPPVASHMGRHPNLAPARVLTEFAIGFERRAELGGYFDAGLRGGRGREGREGDDWRRDP